MQLSNENQTAWTEFPIGIPRCAQRRVLHVINGEHYSGAERVQDLLAQRLPEFGYDVAFACLKPGTFAENRRSLDSPIINLPMRGRIDFSITARLVAAFRDQGAEVLHAHTPRSLLVASAAARKLDCPLIYHVHSPVGRDSGRRFANWFNAWSERHSLRRADRLICVSQSLREYMLAQGHSPDRTLVVRNGVACAPRLAVAARPRQPIRLGMVALFRPRKGIEVLLRAMQILAQEQFPVRLSCIGSFECPEYQQEIVELAAQLQLTEQIEWTGFERDVRGRIENLQALVLPSLYGEGLPMVVLEAMAIGLPVIASRVEGVPEALRDSIDGLLVEPNDHRGLANRIRYLAENSAVWSGLSESSWNRQRAALSDTSMARSIAAVYQDVCAARTR